MKKTFESKYSLAVLLQDFKLISSQEKIDSRNEVIDSILTKCCESHKQHKSCAVAGKPRDNFDCWQSVRKAGAQQINDSHAPKCADLKM